MLNIKRLRTENNLSKTDLAKLVGVTVTTVTNWENTEVLPPAMERLLEYEFGLRQLPSEKAGLSKPSAYPVDGKSLPKGLKAIPLVSSAALGGSSNFDLAIESANVLAEYYAPEFREADFMMHIKGDSMTPTYYQGDVIACKTLHEPSFIEWNRPHVLAVEDRGILVKRVKPGSNDRSYKFVSDNPEYDPFEVPTTSIQSIAIILGMVRVEG
ncbi:S24 family peptidase [Phaeocystidibacter marisrubri]|uniref:S24 family peptidase n=1 Tax=Phaeocystidibacter marisrubri TaxID=1577780 RepID=A0A6L3ZKZ3_9FLAO|nr:S24 family peptidase [Phaeocystidibacter marisrubri]KAB2818198.1 S24 family peptidase [Phaeocystidibacter marisrubri]GGH77997.1 hypothetical protein GCM10011318_28610 [Phaeocystidibacter marisrubri]